MPDIHLAVDNVTELPVGNVRDIPGMLHYLADDIAADFHGEVVSVVSLLVRADGIAVVTYGNPATGYELMGLFEAAKLRVFADGITDDE